MILGAIEESSIVEMGMPYVQKAFQRINIKSVSQSVPAERALNMANSGLTDADPFRVDGLEKTYSNLVRVPGSIYSSVVVVASPNPNLKIRGWESLKMYRVCAKIGSKAVEERLRGMKNVSFSHSLVDMAKMAGKGRCDVIVMHRGDWPKLNTGEIDGIYEIAPILEQRSLYIYLNKKHAALVPRLAEEIEKMRREGLWNEMQEKIDTAAARAKVQIIQRGK
jgi:polar amino acid transport system substrate-binding protein